MKRFLLTSISLVLTAAVVAASMFGYTPRTVHMAALTAIKEGDFEMARSHLLRSDHENAETLLSYMYYVPNKITRTSKDGTETENYVYNYAGRIVKHETTDFGGDMITYSYTYNDLGDPLLCTKVGGDSPDTTTEYFYDKYGHLERKRIIDSEGLFHQYRYVYDALGRVTIEAFVDGDANWSRRVFSYDGEQELLTEQYIDYAGDWQNITYRYEGKVKEQEILENEQGLWITKYNADGKFLSSVYYAAEGGVEKTTFTYDGEGRLIREEHPDGTRVDYIYHEDGQGLEMIKKQADGSSGRYVYEYDDQGRMLSCAEEYSDGTIGTTAYKYNKKGQLTSAKHDGSNDSWWEATYKYDKNNNPETVTLKDKDGTSTLTVQWKVRYYPDGMPEAVQNLCEEYDVDLPEAFQ